MNFGNRTNGPIPRFGSSSRIRPCFNPSTGSNEMNDMSPSIDQRMNSRRGTCNPGNNNHASASALLKRIQALDFARIETQLYLNAHPDNREALKYYKMLLGELSELMEEYEETYGPLTPHGVGDDGWTWTDGPWPWQLEGWED